MTYTESAAPIHPATASPLTAEDQSNLKVLSILWYVMAGMVLLGVPCGLLYVGLGIIALFGGGGDQDATVGGIFLAGTGVFTLVLSIAAAALAYLAGDGLRKQNRRILIYVAAGLACLSVPLGTLLGVFTFIVLGRPTVKAAFDRNAVTGGH